MPKVSVIIPTFNRAHTLGRAIESVLRQSYSDYELIIVDDGSTDDTSEILEKYSELRVLKQENCGVSAARNLGASLAGGEWLAFLDSDDEWLPNKLSEQISYSLDNPQYDLIHGEEIWIRNGKRVNPKNKHQKSGGDIFLRSLKLCLISPSAVMLRKSLYEECGGFDENFTVCEDYDLWLKITARLEVGFIETPIITKYGGHSDQLSAKYFAMDFWRICSLSNFLEDKFLSIDKRRAVAETIVEKGSVLITGYHKHQNYDSLQQVENHVTSARKILVTLN